MHVYLVVLSLIGIGLVGLYIWKYYRQRYLFDQYVHTDLSLFVHDKQENKDRLLASVFIHMHFKDRKIDSLVLKHIAVHSDHYHIRQFDQLVFMTRPGSDPTPLSISLYVDPLEMNKASVVGPLVSLQGMLYFKGGKRMRIGARKRLVLQQDKLQITV